jgi:hypothetical protein
MKKNTYNLLIEPTGSKYSELLDYAITVCKFFLFVTDRDQNYLGPKGKRVLDELAPYLYRMELKSEWPGTILFGTEVPVYIYHFIPASIAILKKSATRLYQWQDPNLPDDLCLLRDDESPWLVTIAHENDSYFELTEDEMQQLVKIIPEYASMIEIANE